jgi:hypothetical protein
MQKILSTSLLVLAAASTVRADPKSDAMTQVGDGITHLVGSRSGYKWNNGTTQIAKVLGSADACLKGAAAAKAAGAKGDEIVTATVAKRHGKDERLATWKTDGTDGGVVYSLPLDEALAYCTEWARTVSLDVLRDDAFYFESWNKTLANPDLTDATTPLFEANQCATLADSAVAYGNPPEAEVKLAKSTVKLGDFKATVCEPVRAAAQKIMDAAAAERDAAMAPFRKLLKGDKLAVWEETFGLDARGTGVGGVDLETPEDFAKANVWFTSYSGEDGGCAVGSSWHLYRYKFKGSKLVGGKPTEKTGCGTSPPAKAYR